MTMAAGPIDALRTLASPIRFSITNEDHRIIERALAPRPDSRLVTIASAGDTPLECLRLGAAEVHAVDVSAPQIHLCALKAAGMRELSHGEFLVLLGVVRDPEQALLLYERVRCALDDEAQRFWDRHRHLIARRLMSQGRMIGFFSLLLRGLRWTAGPEAIEDLAAIRAAEEGRRFVDSQLEKPRVRLVLQSVLGLLLIAHSRQAARVGLSSRRYATALLKRVLTRVPVADNPYVFPFLFGRYPSTDHVPPHLSAVGYAQARPRVDRLRLHHGCIRAFLSTLPEATVDGFELSNVVDWQGTEETAALLEEVARTGRPGAPVLLFSRNGAPTIPRQLRDALEEDPEEDVRLLALDRSGFYRAVVRWRVRTNHLSKSPSSQETARSW